MGEQLALHDTTAFTVYEVSDANEQRALNTQERILDTVRTLYSSFVTFPLGGYNHKPMVTSI